MQIVNLKQPEKEPFPWPLVVVFIICVMIWYFGDSSTYGEGVPYLD